MTVLKLPVSRLPLIFAKLWAENMTDPASRLLRSIYYSEVGVRIISWTSYQRRHEWNRVKFRKRLIEDQMPEEHQTSITMAQRDALTCHRSDKTKLWVHSSFDFTRCDQLTSAIYMARSMRVHIAVNKPVCSVTKMPISRWVRREPTGSHLPRIIFLMISSVSMKPVWCSLCNILE